MKMNWKNKYGWLCVVALCCAQLLVAKEYEVVSPDKQLKIKLNVGKQITYEVLHNTQALISPSVISMTFDNGVVAGLNGTVKDVKREKVSETIHVLFGKNKTLTDEYNELKLNFKEKYSLIVRAYNEGVAYRFQTAFATDVIVNSEQADFIFVGDPSIYFPETDEGMRNFERLYLKFNSIKDIDLNKDYKDKIRYSTVPLLAAYSASYKVIITESDLSDYPGMYLYRPANSINMLTGFWPQYPETVEQPDNVYVNHLPVTRYDYLAKTTGSRVYPWRVIIVSSDDKELLNNQLVYKLARPLELSDVSWIKPGKSAWEWWHKAMLEGVNFPVGMKNLNLELYKYYVDFAAENKIEYLTLDAGWKEYYLKELCDYAKEKGVGIFVWTWANMAVVNPDDWIKKMKTLGVAGLKVDFFERDDQEAMQWRELVAQRCADNQLLLVYHGCPKPTGLERAYPNIVNYEAVRGAECNFWDRGSDPDYHLQFPFIRMVNGPLDYTPGSMRNTTKEQFIPVDKANIIPQTMGTRAHELAMYVLFDQPVGYLCDSPTEYRKYPDVLDFLSEVPTVWDKTVPLVAELGEYAVVAKQSGNSWYVAGMTNWNGREIELDFSFLPKRDEKYKAVLYKDVLHSGTNPAWYVRDEITVSSQEKQKIRMTAGGGFAIRISHANHDAGHSGNDQ